MSVAALIKYCYLRHVRRIHTPADLIGYAMSLQAGRTFAVVDDCIAESSQGFEVILGRLRTVFMTRQIVRIEVRRAAPPHPWHTHARAGPNHRRVLPESTLEPRRPLRPTSMCWATLPCGSARP